MAEGQGEDGPGSVGDSGATPMIVVVVLDDGGGSRATEWAEGRRRVSAEEEEVRCTALHTYTLAFSPCPGLRRSRHPFTLYPCASFSISLLDVS
ncbi:hypothetical protein PUN28_013583 [Cardiocondyla obscurior]|uniref:Uncharacterized protein n=1 Tax=Cardiocondyla obscurior TaxID=286306 RepID=A0AAW2F4L8_9HYME